MTRRRIRISKGIYRDAHGLAAVVEVRGKRKEKRFPPDAPLRLIRDWRRHTAAALQAANRDRRRKLLQADVDAFLTDNATMPSIKSRTVLLNHWVAALGNVSRDDITGPELRNVMQTWRTDGFSASYIRKHLTALSRLYVEYDGRGCRNPVREIELPREPDAEPRALPRALVLRVIDTVTSPKTAARFRVMLETGLPPSDMMKMEPGDLVLDGKEPSMLLRRRRKGKGRKPLRVPLTREAVQALKAFSALGCFGPFDPSSARRVMMTARKALIADDQTTDEERRVLERMRNYDLRHTFGNTIYEATKNLVLTQHMMGHASPQTTMIYTLAAVGDHLKSVPKSVAVRLAKTKR